MCELHQHAKIESWITPEDSRHLSAKMVHLFPGDTVPEHTTGPGREEVIVCIYGTIAVTLEGRQCIVASGEALFIPEDTKHAVALATDCDGAQYVYTATKRRRNTPEICGECGRDWRSHSKGEYGGIDCPVLPTRIIYAMR